MLDRTCSFTLIESHFTLLSDRDVFQSTRSLLGRAIWLAELIIIRGLHDRRVDAYLIKPFCRRSELMSEIMIVLGQSLNWTSLDCAHDIKPSLVVLHVILSRASCLTSTQQNRSFHLQFARSLDVLLVICLPLNHGEGNH